VIQRLPRLRHGPLVLSYRACEFAAGAGEWPTIIGHASDGSGPGYGEYAITDMLGPAIEKTRSPLDVEPG
jgi:hypothetical protein